jgi:hypothetical protein
MSEVQPVLSLAKVVVCNLQEKVLLCGPKHPLAEDAVLMTHPLQCVRHEGGLLHVRVQVRTLLNDDAVGVVLEVEQVLRVLGHLCPLGAEMRTREVASVLKVLAPFDSS